MGMRSFAPVLGFMLGAWTTSVYVDLTGKLMSSFLIISVRVDTTVIRPL